MEIQEHFIVSHVELVSDCPSTPFLLSGRPTVLLLFR